MFESTKISNRQIIFLLIIVISSTGILYLPTSVYKEAKHDSWVSVIAVTLYGIITAYVVVTLGVMFKDQTVIQYSQKIVGRTFGKVIGLSYFVFFIHLNTIVIREFTELLQGPFFAETPLLFLTIGIILPSIYALYQGLEVFARVNEIIFPIFFLIVIGIFILSYRDMDFIKLIPVLAEGWMPVAKAVYYQTTWFGETSVLLILIPSLNLPEKVRRSAIISVIFAGILVLFSNVGVILVFGSQVGQLTYPFLTLARYVSLAETFERLDSFVVFIWVLGVFVKIAILHYCAVICFTQLFNLKEYKKIIIPIGAMLVVLSIIQWSNFLQTMGTLTKRLVTPYGTMQLVIPLILLIIAKLRKLGGRYE
ncbi:MAG: endospore germination permease [Halanaerobiales bacterium]|nr:endospore germination permease [Halanaerobiales bacterium]